MKKTLILIFTLLPFFAFAQCHSSVGFFGGLDYNTRLIPLSLFEEGAKGYLEEGSRIKTRFGVNFINRATDKIYFKTGLRIANIGYNQVIASEYQYGDAINIRNTKEVDLSYLEVPFMFGVNLGHNDVSAFVELGVSPHIFLMGREQGTKPAFWDSFNEYTSYKNDLFNLSANLSVGIDLRVTDDVVTFISPTVRYHFTSTSLEIKGEQLFSVGVECGVRKQINKY